MERWDVILGSWWGLDHWKTPRRQLKISTNGPAGGQRHVSWVHYQYQPHSSVLAIILFIVFFDIGGTRKGDLGNAAIQRDSIELRWTPFLDILATPSPSTRWEIAFGDVSIQFPITFVWEARMLRFA